MLYGYIQQARKFSNLHYTVDHFVTEYSEINRILTLYPSPERASEAQKLFELHQRHGRQVLQTLSQAISNHSDDLAKASLSPTCLLRVAANEPPYDREDEAGQYDLILKPIHPKTMPAVAQLVGENTFDGFLKQLSLAECFFMFHLCQSKTTKKRGGQPYTVVARKELLTSFEEAIEQGCFKRPSDGKIERRFNEYLSRFQDGMKRSRLYGLLVCEAFSGRGPTDKYLGIALPPERIRSDIKSLADILKTSLS